MNPEDFDIPARFRRLNDDAAEDHIGPFFYCPTETGAEAAFRPRGCNINGLGTVHGGVLMTFIDYTLCVAAVCHTRQPCVTVTLNNEFVGPAAEGALLLGNGEVTRVTRSLVFTRGELRSDDDVVLTASAVVKRVRPPS